MAAFALFGKYIVESGGPDILNECHIIEKGSLKSFIFGKRYKRTKRAHQLLALATEILHFLSFVESNEATETFDTIDGENGIYGKTAQCWFGYIRMVQLYHQFIRSIRTGDLELDIFCLKRLSNYFLTFNHPNYGRWLVRITIIF